MVVGDVTVTIEALPRSVRRVADALERHSEVAPDVRVFHVTGRLEHVTRDVEEHDGPFALVQYVVRSSQKPSTRAWLPLWRAAECVWSYYDLPALCEQDGLPADFRFYHAPLGIDDAFRTSRGVKKQYVVATHGDYLTQSTRECVIAACRTRDDARRPSHGGRAAHLGGEFPTDRLVDFYDDITDAELADVYSSSWYVSGLRRCEGFELPAAEGLACGARPILFDRPHYRQWYGDHAEYIEEAPRPDVIDQLRAVFARRRPVPASESAWAVDFFDWDRIIAGFHEALR